LASPIYCAPASAIEHRVGHVGPGHATVGRGHVRGDQQIGPGAAAEIEDISAASIRPERLVIGVTGAKLSTVASGTRESSGSG
jgi:hypothetical protein